MTADGYFRTGDRRDDCGSDGRVSLVGRAKDLIISGGLNVYPKEIETEIDADAWGVGESAVIGVPHADFGEAVVAVVTRADDAGLAEEAGVLSSVWTASWREFKRPKQVLFVDALPRNAMGKVRKNELRDRFGETFSRGIAPGLTAINVAPPVARQPTVNPDPASLPTEGPHGNAPSHVVLAFAVGLGAGAMAARLAWADWRPQVHRAFRCHDDRRPGRPYSRDRRGMRHCGRRHQPCASDLSSRRVLGEAGPAAQFAGDHL